MDEQRIWAPWRIGYIAGDQSPAEPRIQPQSWRPGADQSCFLCRAAACYEDDAAAWRQNLVVDLGEHTFTVLNLYPYTNGHLLVAPLRHVGEFHQLKTEEHLEAMQKLAALTQVYSKLLSAEGFNVGLNLGRVAGAGVPGHLHWHLVPRWLGDNNFMPTVAGTRMISQSLEALWEAVVEALE